MRLIDADALVEAMTKFSDTMGEDMTHGIFYTHIAPTINAVPVVRCKDCKYYEEQDETIGTCLLTESGAHVKGYCSWAEVKDE